MDDGGGGSRMIADSIRDAQRAGRSLRIVAGGTWLDAGQPVHTDSTLAVAGAEQRGIVEYVPGDLTLTARAGTTLAELVAATKANGQWLPLDPWGGDAGTLGATLSTASAGPHAFAMGLPRDVVLGVEFITGAGDVVRAGGRVVKNVAGFDLTRLVIGSWGTLGVITEATVRLRARPDRTATFGIPQNAAALDDLAARLRALPFTPLASELINAPLAQHLGLRAQETLLVRLGGNTNALQAQHDLLKAFGTADEVSPDVWHGLRVHEGAGAGGGNALSVWRWSKRPSAFGDCWRAASAAAARLEGSAARIHGSPARGVVRVVASGPPAALARAAYGFDGTIAVEQLPASAWSPRSTTADGIAQSIRDRFDPAGILNPGILGGQVATTPTLAGVR